MEIGIDIIEIPDLQEKMHTSQLFLHKLLTPLEIHQAQSNVQSLAGKIAAKEAIIKTGYGRVGEWQKMQILNDISGKPFVADESGNKIKAVKISIAHTKNTAVAIAIRM